jgi:hypothetical protein
MRADPDINKEERRETYDDVSVKNIGRGSSFTAVVGYCHKSTD